MPSKTHLSTPSVPAVLVARGASAASHKETVAELARLLCDLGHEPIATLRQRRPPSAARAGIGAGKLAELGELVRTITLERGVPPLVVVSDDLAPNARRLLELETGAPIWDRTDVVLRIFETRAQTELARLEVERARLLREVPRVRDDSGKGDKEGGGGRAARGHTNVELTKRRLEDRLRVLGERLERERARGERNAAARRGVPRVALLGYTNAGKSSWMQALTGSTVLVRDGLFATLGTTVRALRKNAGERILVADTVGFIADLSHDLIRSFESTLREALDADLWIHVADASSPHLEEQMAETDRALVQAGAEPRPRLLLLNKADRLPQAERDRLRADYPEALLVSTLDEADQRAVAAAIRSFVERERRSAS